MDADLPVLMLVIRLAAPLLEAGLESIGGWDDLR
jgi:hypothetical protein